MWNGWAKQQIYTWIKQTNKKQRNRQCAERRRRETIFIFWQQQRKRADEHNKNCWKTEKPNAFGWIAVHCETWRCFWYCCRRRRFYSITVGECTRYNPHNSYYASREQYKLGEDFSCEQIKWRAWSWGRDGTTTSAKIAASIHTYDRFSDECIGIVGAINHVHAARFSIRKIRTHHPSRTDHCVECNVSHANECKGTYVCHFMVDCVPPTGTRAICALRCASSLLGSLDERLIYLWFNKWLHDRNMNEILVSSR